MASTDDLVNNMKNGVLNIGNVTTALNALVAAVKSVFPQQTGTSPTATAGSATLPANPAGFIVTNVPGVGVVKVPYYNE